MRADRKMSKSEKAIRKTIEMVIQKFKELKFEDLAKEFQEIAGDEFIFELLGEDIILSEGIVEALGDHGLDLIEETFQDLAEKYAKKMVEAGLENNLDHCTGASIFFIEF